MIPSTPICFLRIQIPPRALMMLVPVTTMLLQDSGTFKLIRTLQQVKVLHIHRAFNRLPAQGEPPQLHTQQLHQDLSLHILCLCTGMYFFPAYNNFFKIQDFFIQLIKDFKPSKSLKPTNMTYTSTLEKSYINNDVCGVVVKQQKLKMWTLQANATKKLKVQTQVNLLNYIQKQSRKIVEIVVCNQERSLFQYVILNFQQTTIYS